MQIRSAAVSDLASIEALLHASGLPIAGVADHLTSFVVANDAGSVVACGGLEYHGDFALLRSIAVAPQARSGGLGKTVVSWLLSQCETHAVQSVGLLTTTAEGYFTNLGFERVAREQVPRPLLASSQFQGVCPGSATAMLKVLDTR
ncbi:arsenic resistance N-acetyltransferase ArsN2 [Burkholderia contaminans]|uniref:arsenic resistance N-acetyltransferase ArsN2 n=1 Tax=Burkholderia contaminans TaxID=488447 RepID=UPI0031118EC5